ncbi:MAG: hypothetical protein WB660_09155 [Candidatus Sulfotelmatobacter sp.]
MAAKKHVLALALNLLSITACARGGRQQNVCPIDGQPPQWSGPRKRNSCEYFHYSIIEKKTHDWWAACEPEVPSK